MQIIRQKANHLTNAIGIAPEKVLLSYQVQDAIGKWCLASRVELRSDDDERFDTGWLDSRQEGAGWIPAIDPTGWLIPFALKRRMGYHFRVWVKTDHGECDCGEWADFETAKAEGERWVGRWITKPQEIVGHPLFMRRFSVDKPVRAARLYCMGLGLYEAYLNNRKIGDEVLSPGFHTYDAALQYQTWALTPVQGENQLTFLMGEGWYMGKYGLKLDAPRYGNAFGLIAEVRIQYQDGSEEAFGTDEAWQAAESPVLMDSIYDGEHMDARREGLSPTAQAVALSPAPTAPLIPRMSPCLCIQQRLSACPVEGHPRLFDFGQNLAGWVEFDCELPAGAVVRLTFGELLQDGKLYRDNLRRARCEYVYTSDGTRRTVRPHFTYYGFRYIEVEGLSDTPDASQFTACVIFSDMERTGWIKTDHPLLNRLFENQLWSQKSNFLDVPTDCPQRDERMGWTGDIQVFCDTACFNMDCTAFLQKFLFDLSNDQRRLGGCVPMVSPMAGYELRGVSGWGDAATIIPWYTYLHSGDKTVLAQGLPGMMAWVDYISREATAHSSGYLWRGSRQLGDWLALDADSVYGGTDRDFIATVYYYLSACLTAKAAVVLGEDAVADRHTALSEHIREAFIKEYFTKTGRLAVDTQTAYTMVLFLNLTPQNARECCAKRLRQKILAANGKLQTGFLGTVWLLSALCESGSADMAYDLLLNKDYPGWLYEVNCGATTIWERWNSIEPDGSMNRDGMNSLNHYAYGSVAGWMYRYMGGIQPVDGAPGFRRVRIAPIPDRRIGQCDTKLLSPHGLYTVKWAWQNAALLLDIAVPFGCEAHLRMPGLEESLLPGQHHFELNMPVVCRDPDEITCQEAVTHAPTRKMLSAQFPVALRWAERGMYSLGQLLESPFAELTDEDIEAFRAAVTKTIHEPSQE